MFVVRPSKALSDFVFGLVELVVVYFLVGSLVDMEL